MADPKELALQHFEKVLLGAGAAWMIYMGIGMASEPKELSANARLAANVDEIEAYMKSAKAPPAEEPAWGDALSKRLDPSGIGSAGEEPYPGWVLHKRPGFLYDTKPPPPTHTPKHYAPVDVQADAGDRGKIDVRWDRSPDNEYVIVDHYVIERRVGEDGEWSKVGEVKGSDPQEYSDSDIVSRTDYYYRVISVARIDDENPVVRHDDLELDPAESKKVSSVAGPVTTKRDVFVLPVTVQHVTTEDLIANPNATESAYVRVYKWDNEAGEFIKETFTVKVGESIGGYKKRGGKEYDFSTGATLVDVDVRKRRHPTLNYDQSIQVIKFRFEDGSEEETNDKDVPSELEGVK